MKALRYVLSKTLNLFSAKYWFNLGRQETSRHGCINVGSDTKHQYKQTKSTQNNKETLMSIFCRSCVRLLIHRFSGSAVAQW